MEITAGSDPLDPGNIPGSACGDINGDGSVDMVDVALGQRILLGDLTADANQLLRGDVAPLVGGAPLQDGLFTAGDLYLITAKVLGQISF